MDVGSRVFSLPGTLDGGRCGLTTAGESSARTCWPTRPCSMFCFVRRSLSMLRWLCISRCAPLSQCSCAGADARVARACARETPQLQAQVATPAGAGRCEQHERCERGRARRRAGAAWRGAATRLVLVATALDALVQRLELSRLCALHLQLLGRIHNLQLIFNLGLLPRLELVGLELGGLRVHVPAQTRDAPAARAPGRACG